MCLEARVSRSHVHGAVQSVEGGHAKRSGHTCPRPLHLNLHPTFLHLPPGFRRTTATQSRASFLENPATNMWPATSQVSGPAATRLDLLRLLYTTA